LGVVSDATLCDEVAERAGALEGVDHVGRLSGGAPRGRRLAEIVEGAVDGEDRDVVVPDELRRGNVRVCMYIYIEWV